MSLDVQTPTLTSVVMRTVSALLPFIEPRRLSRRRVLRWSRRHGCQVLRWRDAKLFEGPSSWQPHEHHYRIQIIDASGQRRAAYLTFARPFVLERCTEVLWDDPSGRKVPGSPEARPTEDDHPSGLVPITSLPR